MPYTPQIRFLGSAAAGGDHTLLANDVESASSVSSPVLAQVHVLTVVSAESASEVSAPAITSGDNLLADDVESASEVSSPAVAQVHNLTVISTESASELTSPALSDGTVQAAVETPTGGFAWHSSVWQPTKEQIKQQRIELGIIKPEIDQIRRVIKKVSKGEIKPDQAREEARSYFAKQDLQYQPKHEEAVSNLLSFLRDNLDYNPVEYAAQRAQEQAQQAKAQYEHDMLILELQAQRDAIEEQDMVFVITVLAA